MFLLIFNYRQVSKETIRNLSTLLETIHVNDIDQQEWAQFFIALLGSGDKSKEYTKRELL